LARALSSFKRLVIIVDASNDILSNTANITPPSLASLFYVVRCEAGSGNSLRHEKCEFLSECGRAKCFFFQSSKPNELIFNAVLLKGPHGPATTLKIVMTSRVR